MTDASTAAAAGGPGAALRPAATLPSALARFDLLAARIGRRRPAVFLDFDGTLTPIMPRPDLAVLAEPTRAAVAALARRDMVAVVSGRDRAVVERLVGISGIAYAGSHGFDIELPDGRTLVHDGHVDYGAVLARAGAALDRTAGRVAGTVIEHKKFTVAVHYRNVAPAEISGIAAAVERVLAAEPDLKVTAGKMVYELTPNLDWDKGKAVLWLMRALGVNGPGHVPLFFGDDVTDEHAFTAIADRGLGVICIDPHEDRPTAASFRVDDPRQVTEALWRLARLP